MPVFRPASRKARCTLCFETISANTSEYSSEINRRGKLIDFVSFALALLSLKHACLINSEKMYISWEILCGTCFTRCSVRRRNASGPRVEWHSNREDSPDSTATAEQQKKSETVKISDDVPELVPEGQQSSLTTNNYLSFILFDPCSTRLRIISSLHLCNNNHTYFLTLIY